MIFAKNQIWRDFWENRSIRQILSFTWKVEILTKNRVKWGSDNDFICDEFWIFIKKSRFLRKIEQNRAQRTSLRSINFKIFTKNRVFLKNLWFLQKREQASLFSLKLFNYIENYNNSLTNKIINNHMQSTTDKLKELSKFYNRTNTISINTTKKIIEDNYAKNNFN